MPKLEELIYEAWDGSSRLIRFSDENSTERDFYTTVLTGVNGSHKSTILCELVKALALEEYRANVKTKALPVDDIGGPVVICASGSVADRFPPKEHGGRYTDYMVPNYIYLGQRVGNNLLSKKRPLDTALAFAMDENCRERFGWSFFRRAFKFSNIYPELHAKFVIKASDRFKSGVLGELLANKSGETSSTKRVGGRAIPPAMADYLLNEFDYDDFSELDDFIKRRSRSRPVSAWLGDSGVRSDDVSASCIRLGLLADVFSLSDVRVSSLLGTGEYSAFDLSSGEYHMLASLLGLGFSIKSGAVVLIDEPENSLHPQWQLDFMDALYETCMQVRGVHLVVSTHSPLVVGSVRPGSSVVDLSFENDPHDQALYGAAADEILLEQFGVASSRNRFVVDTVQRAIEIFEKTDEKERINFGDTEDELRRIRVALRDGDPLIDVIDALLDGAI